MDKDSVPIHPFWDWPRQRLEEARCRDSTSNDNINFSIHHQDNSLYFHSDVYKYIMGGVPIFFSFVDCHHLPHLGMKAISGMYTNQR